ncbi:MAG: polysaccharide deacetylase family protein [Desertimonas sp.]
MRLADGRRLLKGALRNTVGLAAAIIRRPSVETPRVLCYHGVCTEPPDEWSVTPAQLRAHMAELVTNANPVSLDDVVAWHLGERELPPRSVAVSFDDGFVDLLDTAAPILAEYSVPATVFVAAGLAGGSAPAPGYVPSRPLMDWSQVRALVAAGWDVGSHSVDHPTLIALDDRGVAEQLTGSRDMLEQSLGRPVTLLAYPYGTASTVGSRDKRAARAAGYRAAFMDMTGAVPRRADAPDGSTWDLPRSKVLGTDRMFTVRSSIRGGMDVWRRVERRGGGG